MLHHFALLSILFVIAEVSVACLGRYFHSSVMYSLVVVILFGSVILLLVPLLRLFVFLFLAGIPSETLSLYGNPCIPEQLLKEGMYKIVGGAAKNNSRLQY